MAQKNSKGRGGLFASSSVMLAAMAAVALPSAAHAQDTDDEEEIIVTGSRIGQDSTLTAPSPVVSMGGDDIRTSGQIDVATLLRESPALQASLPGSFSAFNGTPLGASTLNLRNLGDVRTLVLEDGRRHVAGIEGTGSVDVNTISTALLERVEVLTGGASAVYGGDAVTGVVNFLLRDGDSFDGWEFRGQLGQSSRGDADEMFASIANGWESEGGRASMVVALEYQTVDPILAGDRDFAGSGLRTFAPNNAATQAAFGVDPRFANTWVPDYRLPISSDAGIIAVGEAGTFPSAFLEVAFSGGVPGCWTYGTLNPIPTCQIYDNGNLRPYNPGDVYIDPFNASGGDGVPGSPDSELIWPNSERWLAQTAYRYELTPNMNFFANLKFVYTETTESNQVNGFNDDIPIALDNPFIPAPLRAQLDQLIADGDNPEVVVSRDVLDMTARNNPIAERTTWRFVTGFDGELNILNGLDYQISYNYGRTDANITSRNRIEDRYFAALDAIEDPDTGEIVCRSERLDLYPGAIVPPSSPFPATDPGFQITTFTPGTGACVPVNIFGYDSITPEAAAFIFQAGTDKNDVTQEVFNASFAGNTEGFFSLPAGPVGYAFGYEWRREESSFTPDFWEASGLTFTSQESRSGPALPSGGEYDVHEYYLETQLPLLANLPLVHYLEFRGAFRQSDYSTFGETETWTMGGRWQPVEDLTFRVTQSEAVRIPNIGEAFSPLLPASIGASQDPCNQSFINAGSQFREDNCIALIGATVANGTYDSTDFVSAQIIGTVGGNPDLDPETAETFTAGFVYRPVGDFNGLLDGFILTIDYYEIEIQGLIASLTGFQIAENCVDAASINNQFCDAVDRDPTDGFITDFRSGFINLAAVETTGIDFRIDYLIPTSWGLPGDLRLAALGTNFLSNDETRDVTAPEEVTDVLTTLTRPEWIVNYTADWTFGALTLGWRGRYESDQLAPGLEPQDIQNDPDFIDITHTGSSWVHDFSVAYDLSERVELYGGVNNAFDEEPYIGTLGRPAGPRGQFFYAGVNARF